MSREHRLGKAWEHTFAFNESNFWEGISIENSLSLSTVFAHKPRSVLNSPVVMLIRVYNKQNKTKQNKTKQNKTKQNKTKQNKTKQNKTKQKKPKVSVISSFSRLRKIHTGLTSNA